MNSAQQFVIIYPHVWGQVSPSREEMSSPEKAKKWMERAFHLVANEDYGDDYGDFVANVIDGVVITFLDISEYKKLEAELRQAQGKAV